MKPKRPEITVYYDGSCPLCSIEIGHYESRDGAERICFLNVADAATDPGPGLDQGSALKRFHIRKADGTVLSGAAAFTEIWATLPGWHWLARIARLPGMPWLLELAYRGFLPIRPLLSRIAKHFGATPRTPSPLDTRHKPS